MEIIHLLLFFGALALTAWQVKAWRKFRTALNSANPMPTIEWRRYMRREIRKQQAEIRHHRLQCQRNRQHQSHNRGRI